MTIREYYRDIGVDDKVRDFGISTDRYNSNDKIISVD